MKYDKTFLEKANWLSKELFDELNHRIIPFWSRLRDGEYGGYYGWLDYNLVLDKKAVKGCILNSRITWFFSESYIFSEKRGEPDKKLLELAKHGYDFLTEYCTDKVNGGIFWSLNYDGTPCDATKHTYNQAFAIYALSAYYEASGDEKALAQAYELFEIIESRCVDDAGYIEALSENFKPQSNEKLSENGVVADRTMNTLLHMLEAYTQLYRVGRQEKVKKRLMWILDTFVSKVYNPVLKRQEVFFDSEYNSLIDLHSYGHDIEASWLLDRAVEVLDEPVYEEKIHPVTDALCSKVREVAFVDNSLIYECDRGKINTNRMWWVQSETIVGFVNYRRKHQECEEYLDDAIKVWKYIKEYVIDKRPGSEWYWIVKENGEPLEGEPIVEPWKCPYHNGRMCIETILMTEDLSKEF